VVDQASPQDDAAKVVLSPVLNPAPPIELALLYDNGPLVNLPGGGAGGADASVLQTALTLTVFGFSHSVATNNHVADDFTVPAGGWTVDSLVFYAYQTGSTTTSTITGVRYQIWDGVPGAPGSSVVFGDLTTNRLTNTTWSNAYRVLDTDLLNTQRPAMKNRVSGGFTLAAGTYWVEWFTDGSLASGPWAPPITVSGETSTGNGLQFLGASSEWVVLLDGLFPQGLPFKIYGTGAPSTAPRIAVFPDSLIGAFVQGDPDTATGIVTITNDGGVAAGDLTWTISENPVVSWLEVVPTAGTTTANTSDEVEVRVNVATLPPGTYTTNVEVSSNAANGTLKTVAVTIDVLSPPVMSVAPASLSANLQPGQTQDQTITITNSGDLPLTFAIAIQPTAALSTRVAPSASAAPERIPLSPEQSAAAFDLAQSEAGKPAVRLDWNYRHPRANESDVLYDNGPLVNLPGGGFGGADASVLQSVSLAMNVLGFGHAVASGFRVADDFVVPPGGWDIEKFTFYAYQTGSTTTSTINNVNFQIWDGPPGAPGSNVVFGDVTTNRLTSTSWANMYRVSETTLTGNTRPVMANVCQLAAPLNLGPGTYWLDWQTGGTLASGPWAPPVTINGVTNTGNGLQFNGTAWSPLVDTGTTGTSNFLQGLPFIIEGIPPAPFWLSTSPTVGVVDGNSSVNVTVTFDATGLASGTYTADIVVSGDDPNNPEDVVQATLQVGGCTPGLLGDINGDDAVNSLDALLMLSYDAGLPLPQPFLDRIAIGFGDVTEDGLTNSTDALVTLSWEVGFPVPFPVGTTVCLPAPAALGKSTVRPAAQGSEVQAYAGLNFSGQTLDVPVMIDMANSGEKLGSYTMSMSWNPALLEFSGFSGGNTEGFADPVVNDLNAKQGRLVAAHAYPQGAGGEVNILNARFTVKGSLEALPANPIALNFSAMAAARSFTDLLPAVKVLDAIAEAPASFALENYPNPFNPATEIRYQLPEAAEVQIVVYNLLGQKVQTLVNGRQQAGAYTVRWEGVNEQNQAVPSGMYFLRMKAGKFVADRKLMLLK